RHQVRAARITHRLDVRVRAREEGRADRDADGVVDVRARRARADERLRVRPDVLAEARAAETGAEEELQRSEHPRCDDDLFGAEDLAAAGPSRPACDDLPAAGDPA